MINRTVAVRKVENDAEMRTFLHFPWTCYRDDPNWVPPLLSKHETHFDRKKSVELRHMDIDYFVAWRGGAPVGIMAAFVNHAYNDFHKQNIGFFGGFEVLEDEEAAHALLEAAEAWCRGKGVTAVRGPATFSTNSEIGLLVDGYDRSPMILTTYAHPYYKALIESAGYKKEMDLLAYYVDARVFGGKEADKIPEKLTRVMEKVRKRRNFTVRNVNMRDFDNEVARIKKIYNSAWEENWGFVPLSDAEIDELARDLKPFVDPDIAFFVEARGEPIAFCLPLPDIYEPLRLAYPRPTQPETFVLLRLIWHWKIRRRLTGMRAFALGVVKEYRGTGVDGLLYLETIKAGLRKGYVHAEMSWILEDNDMMKRGVRLLGGEVYKTYRVYEKPL